MRSALSRLSEGAKDFNLQYPEFLKALSSLDLTRMNYSVQLSLTLISCENKSRL